MYRAIILLGMRNRLTIDEGEYEKCKDAVDKHIEMLTAYEQYNRGEPGFKFEVRQPLLGFRFELYNPVAKRYSITANLRCAFLIEKVRENGLPDND